MPAGELEDDFHALANAIVGYYNELHRQKSKLQDKINSMTDIYVLLGRDINKIKTEIKKKKPQSSCEKCSTIYDDGTMPL